MKYLTSLAAAAAFLLTHAVARAEPLKVMTFNLFHGGDGGKQPLSQSVAVIQTAGADVIGLQEIQGFGDPAPDNAAKLSRSLGWNYLYQGDTTGIISKHKSSLLRRESAAFCCKRRRAIATGCSTRIWRTHLISPINF